MMPIGALLLTVTACGGTCDSDPKGYLEQSVHVTETEVTAADSDGDGAWTTDECGPLCLSRMSFRSIDECSITGPNTSNDTYLLTCAGDYPAGCGSM